MKKIITFIMFITVSMCMYMHAENRKVVVDEIQHGVHVVEPLGTKIGGFTETKPLFIGLQRWTTETDTLYVVCTNVCTLYDLGVRDDALMLIKTTNGDVIELESVMADSNNYTYRYGSPTITVTRFKNMVTARYNDNSTNVVRNINYWKVSEEDLSKIKDGIIKIRIMFKNGTYDKSFKKDKIGNVLWESYETLLNYNDNTAKDDFRKDF